MNNSQAPNNPKSLKAEFRLSSEQAHMLRKSSKCEKGKNLHNGEFTGESVDSSDCKGKINTSSIQYVSNLIEKVLKNAFLTSFYISKFHRDKMIHESTRLYCFKKPVFLYSRLALIETSEASSETLVINLLILLQ